MADEHSRQAGEAHAIAPRRPVLSGRILRVLPVVLFIGLAGLFYWQLASGKDASVLPSALLGKPAPSFTLPALEGVPGADGAALPGLTSADLAGRGVTVLNVWASWCVPCRAEHPVITEIASLDGVRLVGLNYKDQTAAAQAFLKELGNPFERIGVDGDGRAGVAWGIYGVPETFIIDASGIVRYRHPGPIDGEQFSAIIYPEIERARSPLPAGDEPIAY